jgi:hypothetical protein
MTNNQNLQNRANYVYLLIGTILKKSLRRNPKYQQHYYQLHIACETNPQVRKLFAFQPKLANPNIWKVIETSNCLGKKYQFFCKNYSGHYYVVNWEQLSKTAQDPQTNHHDNNK